MSQDKGPKQIYKAKILAKVKETYWYEAVGNVDNDAVSVCPGTQCDGQTLTQDKVGSTHKV